jgi:hypothetical protein
MPILTYIVRFVTDGCEYKLIVHNCRRSLDARQALMDEYTYDKIKTIEPWNGKEVYDLETECPN